MILSTILFEPGDKIFTVILRSLKMLNRFKEKAFLKNETDIDSKAFIRS